MVYVLFRKVTTVYSKKDVNTEAPSVDVIQSYVILNHVEHLLNHTRRKRQGGLGQATTWPVC
jgi:hypothetical protein